VEDDAKSGELVTRLVGPAGFPAAVASSKPCDPLGAGSSIASVTTDHSWAASSLPRDIVRALDVPKPLVQLADELVVTDARVLWYLERLQDSGLVQRSGGSWVRTELGEAFLAEPESQTDDQTILPGRTVYDYRQAFADAQAGMFGERYTQAGGEHASRMSFEQAQEFQQRLTSLIAEYFAPDRGDRSGIKYGFHWVLTPTDLHPLETGKRP